MTDEDLKQWFMETLSEGGYSFVEFWQYANRNNVGTTKIVSLLYQMFNEGLLEFYLLGDDSYDLVSDYNSAKECISRFENIVDQETNGRVIHYIELSK